MTSNDVAVATPPDGTNVQRPDRSIAEQFVEQAKADGRSLVGPGGLLADLTKQVLETGLEVEMEDHVGYPKHAAEGPQPRQLTQRDAFEDGGHRDRPGRGRCAA